jgi:hypothetical protein
MTVKPGDQMSASVTYIGNNKFTMKITDVTRKETFSITQTEAGAQRSSAEWIVEAPSSITGVLPLADFGKVTFTQASATINDVTGPIDSSSWQHTAINMVKPSGALKASTSGLTDSTSGGSTTSSFSVSYIAAASTDLSDLTPGLGGGHHHHGGSWGERWLW